MWQMGFLRGKVFFFLFWCVHVFEFRIFHAGYFVLWKFSWWSQRICEIIFYKIYNNCLTNTKNVLITETNILKYISLTLRRHHKQLTANYLVCFTYCDTCHSILGHLRAKTHDIYTCCLELNIETATACFNDFFLSNNFDKKNGVGQSFRASALHAENFVFKSQLRES